MYIISNNNMFPLKIYNRKQTASFLKTLAPLLSDDDWVELHRSENASSYAEAVKALAEAKAPLKVKD